MTSGANAPNELIQDLFVAQATGAPDRPAVISDAGTLTYGELLRRARACARKLRDLGARPNSLVAVAMEKGWEQIVAVLAIVESGAAYLPIDIQVPRERLWYLLKNGEVQIVLTQSRLDSSLEWPANVIRLSIDAEASEGDGEPLERVQTPDDLAYVLYTSGSTGKPKGVMIAHRGVVNCIRETNRTFQISAGDRCLALTALHHDMSVYDIFGLLGAGGAMVVPDAAGSRAPAVWVRLIDEHGVTVWNSVPAFMEMLLEYASRKELRIPGRLRLAFLGGDWIPVTAPHRIQAHFGDVQVVSVGGPTETTVWNIWYPIQALNPDWKSIPYGHPIANTRYYVLDESLRDCPAGDVGELCCAGVGLMKGYWRDEERTRARFAIHPRTGETILRTGDRGRLRPDGEIEFVGRTDSQVKVLGQRIELQEIESILMGHPGVSRAVVTVASREPASSPYLAAYIVPVAGETPRSNELREFLSRELPDYMIPSAFVRMTELPLSSNGKLDRTALPMPSSENGFDTASYHAAESPVEIQLAEILAQLLGLDRVGREDNFFLLGGQSLLGAQLIVRVRERFGVQLRLRDLFETQTVAKLAGRIERELTSSLESMSEEEASRILSMLERR